MTLPTDHPFKASPPTKGVRVYAKFDSATKNADLTLSNGNLTVTRAATNNNNWRSIRANIGVRSGKWYWELVQTAGTINDAAFGVGNTQLSASSYVGSDAQSWSYQSATAFATVLKYNNAASAEVGSGGSKWTTNDIIQIAFDADNNSIWYGFNGTWRGPSSPNPATNTSPQFNGTLTPNLYPAICAFSSGIIITANFGASAFAYTPPSGFNAGLYIDP